MTDLERKAYCTGIKGIKEDEMAFVRQCFPKLAALFKEMCSTGSGTAYYTRTRAAEVARTCQRVFERGQSCTKNVVWSLNACFDLCRRQG